MGDYWMGVLAAGCAGMMIGAGLSWVWRMRLDQSLGQISEGMDGPPLDIGVGSEDWLEGADLMRYPDQLARLERRIDKSCLEVEDQIRYLKRQGDRVAAKDRGSGLSARYEADAAQLSERMAQLKRVLAMVWRTRSILILRVRVAIVARACPRIGDLPEVFEFGKDWEETAEAFRTFRIRIRNAMNETRTALSDLALSLPSQPGRARLEDGEREDIDGELSRARQTLEQVEARMDRLADMVVYLADRCRTHEVVEAAPLELSPQGDASDLLNEVSESLLELDFLSDVVDQRLAENAMDNLAAGITLLERDGLDAQAETDAALEVDRLLDQFPR